MILSHETALHHGYLIESSTGDTVRELVSEIEEYFGVQKKGNPDFNIIETNLFKIDDARKLKYTQAQKSVKDSPQIFVIRAGGITTQAQNALLKVLEEPSSNTYVFIIVPTVATLLPTLLSRCFVYKSHTYSDISKEFLDSSKKDRLEIVAKLLKEKDTQKIHEFISSLEFLILKRKHSIKSLDVLTTVKKYSSEQGASHKVLLEYLSLCLD